MNKQKYIGVTIGPIYRTLFMARKTRELWGASYLFSYIMRNLAERLLEFGIQKDDLIVPAIVDNQSYNYGAGLAPDRLILKSQEGYWEKLEVAVNETATKLASNIALDLGHKSSNDLEDYLRQYFQIHCVEIELENGANPVLEISPFLEVQELHERFVLKDHRGFLGKFLDKVNGSFLFNDAYANADPPKKRFDSLPEIATRPLRGKNKSVYDNLVKEHIEPGSDKKDREVETDFLTAIKKEFSNDFKTCHKYVAIVSADGDFIGTRLKEIGANQEALLEFSRKMNDFSRNAAEIIYKSGGAPVYAGGDDLLFFAPADGIFQLLEKLDEEFQERFPKCSLSYGVAITFYKFPLEEALKQSRDLLTESKRFKGSSTEQEKNAISYSILKHGGRAFGATLYKGDGNRFYSEFMKLLEDFGDKLPYLKSTIRSVEKYDPIFREIGPDLNAITNFMNNSFDEDIHKDYKETIKKVCQLVALQMETPGSGQENTVHALLRTLHFLKRTDNEE